MSYFKKGGNKKRKQKKYAQENVANIDDEQMFAQIIGATGGRHFTVLCTDNIKRDGRICTRLKKGMRLVPGTFVVISLRSYESEQSKHCDILNIGNPPHDIITLFQKNKSNNIKNDIIFHDENNKFDNINSNNGNEVNKDINK